MISCNVGDAVETPLWGVVPAAGDGKGLQDYVRRVTETDLPKQYVNFAGRRSTFAHTCSAPSA